MIPPVIDPFFAALEQSAPASNKQIAASTSTELVIDVDSLPDDVGMIPDDSQQPWASESHQFHSDPCTGLSITMPPHTNAYEAYPIRLHKDQLPWDVQFVNGGASIIVWAHGCQKTVPKGTKVCKSCGGLLESGYLPGIISQMSKGIDENTPLSYFGVGGLVEIIHCKDHQIQTLHLGKLNIVK